MCVCADVTDPNLFMFTKISIDSGHGAGFTLFSFLSLTHSMFLIFTLSPTNVSDTTQVSLCVSEVISLFRSFEVQPEFVSSTN